MGLASTELCSHMAPEEKKHGGSILMGLSPLETAWHSLPVAILSPQRALPCPAASGLRKEGVTPMLTNMTTSLSIVQLTRSFPSRQLSSVLNVFGP